MNNYKSKKEELKAYEDFLKCVNIGPLSVDGKFEITCKLGLWSVYGDADNIVKEAFNYYNQYKEDGEYSDILGGPNSLEVFMKRLDVKKEC